jgi:hypothetical protein
VAIVAILSDSFDDTDWRLIGTSLSFAAYSSLAAGGAALRAKEHPAARPLGALTRSTPRPERSPSPARSRSTRTTRPCG